MKSKCRIKNYRHAVVVVLKVTNVTATVLPQSNNMKLSDVATVTKGGGA